MIRFYKYAAHAIEARAIFTRLRFVLVFACLLIASQSSGPLLAAPPTLDHFFPAGGQRGTTIQITANGKFDTWPVDVWTDREGLSIQPEKDKGKFKVTVDDNAVGTYWLRLHNKDGATGLRPFVVGTLPEVLEAEANDDPQKPQQLSQSCVVNGKLAKSGDVDGYSIPLTSGQTLVVSMTANRVLGSPMDAVTQICDAKGFVLAQNDDAGSLDPHLVFKVPYDGTYLIRAFAFPEKANSTINFAGASNFVYRLTITTGGFAEYCLPMSVQPAKPTTVRFEGWNLAPEAKAAAIESGDEKSYQPVFHPAVANAVSVPVLKDLPIVASPDATSEKPQSLEIPCVVSGVLSAPKTSHTFAFSAKKGQKIELRVESRSLGFPLDAVIRVSDSNGKLIKEIDDASQNRDPVYSLAVPQDGEYRVSIRDLHGRGGKRFAYRLSATNAEPAFTLSVEADVFILASDKDLEIPVTINRHNGFADEIKIEAVGLPEGASVIPATSLAKGESAKSVKLKLKKIGKPTSSSFHIIGRAAERSTVTATFKQAAPEHVHDDLWLHVIRDAAGK